MAGRRTLYTDNFTGDSTDLGVNWDPYAGVDSLHRVADQVRCSVVGAAVDNIESHSGALANDQWASMIINFLTDSTVAYSSAGVGVRWAAPNTVSGYLFYVDSSSSQFRVSLQKYTTGTFAQITGTPSNFVNITLAANDEFALEAVGTTLIGYQNGTPRITGTDSAFAAGRAALECFVAGSFTDARLDSFASGDFTSIPYDRWHQLAPLMAQ